MIRPSSECVLSLFSYASTGCHVSLGQCFKHLCKAFCKTGLVFFRNGKEACYYQKCYAHIFTSTLPQEFLIVCDQTVLNVHDSFLLLGLSRFFCRYLSDGSRYGMFMQRSMLSMSLNAVWMPCGCCSRVGVRISQDDAITAPLGPEPHQSVDEIQRIVREARVKESSAKSGIKDLEDELLEEEYNI